MKKVRKILSVMLVLLCFLASALPRAYAQETDAASKSESVTVTADLDLPDSETLFEGYAMQTLYGSAATPYGIMAGERLDPTNKAVYSSLKEQISLVADGKLASTEFAFSQGELINLGVKTVWTMEDLGVENIIVQGQIDSAVMAQIQQDVYEQVNLDGLLTALLSDCPYEMYWSSKSITSYFYVNAWQGASGEGEVTVQSMSFLFYVGAAFADGQADLADTKKTAAASQAAGNARKIIDQYAGCSDYEKLVGYKERICDLVTYDYGAANDANAFSQDSNPWQLISVFDGVSTTNVVCEGYSKAFQYLCDLSSFSGDVICCNVTGMMDTPSSSGGHMWNIVTLEGQNYLADVTNSDSGTLGAGGGLFLAGTSNGSITDGYVFTVGKADAVFTYSDAVLNLWGTGEDSILKLADRDYTPPVSQEPEPVTVADLTGDGSIDEEDAVYLIWHTLMPDLFPVDDTLDLDFDGVNGVTDADALELLWYALGNE